MAVVIETTLGDLTVDLFIEQRPIACLNFIKLCKLKYYNYNLFHTIQHQFIAQTGDPTGEGTGGQSIMGIIEGSEKRYFKAEKMPKIKHTTPGLLSMVATDDGMVGSQFFFTLSSDLNSLDGNHCVIGEVTEGHDVLRLMNETICDVTHRPYQDVRITHTVILDDPFDDPKGFHEPSRSPSPSKERLAGGRIAPDEEIDEFKGKSAEEIAEMIEEKEAKARATILEIVGDLPDAEMAPPENVLFVCKLNPVTSDDDLEIIFSRFGKIKCCEVIRDKKTGDSLQYAFIEFEEKKSCEDAYLKMDNNLIDDRRIHVDFSQSVSKIKWRGKGKGVIHLDDESVGRNDIHISNKNSQYGKNHFKSNDFQDKDRYVKNIHNNSHSRKNHSPNRNVPLRYNSSEKYSHKSSKDREKQRYRDDHSHSSVDRVRERQTDSLKYNNQKNKDKNEDNDRSNYSRKSYVSPQRHVSKNHNRNKSPSVERRHKKSTTCESEKVSSNSQHQKHDRYDNVSKSNSQQHNSSASKKNYRKSLTPDRNPSTSKSNIEQNKHKDVHDKSDRGISSIEQSRKVDVKSKKRKHSNDNEKVPEEETPKKKKKTVEKKIKKHKSNKQKRSKSSSSDTEDSSDESDNKSSKKGKKHKKKSSSISNKKKKHRSSSSSSTSSSDSSDESSSSSSDSDKRKRKKKPSKVSKKKTKKRKSRKESSSSSSSDSSSSSSEDSSSSTDTSDSGHERSRKKSKNKKSVREKLIKKKSKKK